jgi:hypothetical protein
MKKEFANMQSARNYIKENTIGFDIIAPKTLFIIEDGVIEQEHLSFYDKNEETKIHFSIVRRTDRVELSFEKQKMSKLVHACETGNINLFEEYISKRNYESTLALAFKQAIYNDQLEIVTKFIDGKYLSNVKLYQNPIITSTIFDSVKSYKFLIKHFDIPIEILSNILRHNSINILKETISNKEICHNIINSKTQNTGWVKRLEKELENEAVKIYTWYLKGYIYQFTI